MYTLDTIVSKSHSVCHLSVANPEFLATGGEGNGELLMYVSNLINFEYLLAGIVLPSILPIWLVNFCSLFGAIQVCNAGSGTSAKIL